ncbi:uncharacterized protein LOC111598459 [Drosophila hydei]|uniref:Uncharacterized protein LOC111598459 n=1 Tax=Drosophila hydei TaxID=7224 RepID=A0A6J2SQG5_DROHY|nr:uncharacterized protein LOC111598459 [Drosophila hydei]
MAATGIYFVGALLLCLCACAWAAPSVSDLEQFGELERTLKDLATSVLAMNGGTAGGGESGMSKYFLLPSMTLFTTRCSPYSGCQCEGSGERYGLGKRWRDYFGVSEQAVPMKMVRVDGAQFSVLLDNVLADL